MLALVTTAAVLVLPSATRSFSRDGPGMSPRRP
jgi:hypothetical protein